MPPSLGKLLDLVPVGGDAYYLMREGTLSGTALEPRHAELLLVTVLAADYSNWASVHMDGARRAGASEAEVAEAVLCAVPVAGLSAWVVGATAMDAGAK
jgi:alkylhydroperoxidase/carboxymuconolactone decarboxylase family protein YurZ